MKLSVAIIATTLAVSQAFSVAPSGTSSSTQLNAAPMDRRGLLTNAAALAVSGVFIAPGVAFAAEFEPTFNDVKQIYYLGASLDRLVEKLSNPDTVEAGLEGVRSFNKDANFYPGYARNFVLKIVKKGADNDPRTGYIKQACALIGSVETVVVSFDASTAKEGIDRVKKAQILIARFLAESGVTGNEKMDAFIASHK